MKYTKFYGIDGAKKATGVVIIIDILRAATVVAFILAKKAKYIIPVSTKEEALILKKQNKGYILVGEENGYKIPGFDFGNSPSELEHTDLKNKIIIHRSSMGTQGILAAQKANQIIFGSFTVLSAIINYIKNKDIKQLSLVAMDGSGSEDEMFADFVIAKLEGKINDINLVKKTLIKHKGAERFLDPKQIDFPREDFDLCLKLDLFNFVPLVSEEQGRKIIKAQKTTPWSGLDRCEAPYYSRSAQL